MLMLSIHLIMLAVGMTSVPLLHAGLWLPWGMANTAMHLTRPLQVTEAHRVALTSSILRAGDGQR